MTDDCRERAWAVFDQLADVPAGEREAVLRAACGDDPALRAEVERLLALDDRLAPAGGETGFLILVDETGQPKVLDFGVARATDADLLTGAGLTRTGQLLGTPRYMSPEQVTADPAAIDHRADVYTLGAILFELLAHRLPHQLENLPLPEAARLILEQDPPRLGSLDPGLRGDVETIAAKALAKDPARRYPSAADLAADLRRSLAHEPILARPPSALYHLRQFARRNKGLVGGVLATGAALVLGLVGTILFAVGEARQRGQAEHNYWAALDEKREAQFQAYRARLAAAAAALAVHDVADAARQLDAAPEDLRDWEWRHLRSWLDDSSSVIPLPSTRAGLLLGTPGGFGAWARAGADLRVTDLASGEHRTLPAGPDRRRSVSAAQTRRGLRVAVEVGDTTFDLLDEAGRVLGRLEMPDAKGRPIAISPDGTRLAGLRRDGVSNRLVVYDASSGKPMAVCDGHRDGVWALTFSPDGTRLASASEDRLARLWDVATGTLLAECRGHAGKVLGATFRPDGARLVTASSDGTVRQWDAATGREVEPAYDRHTGEVVAAAYSPDGRWVASVGTDRTVRVWRADGRKDVAVLHGHTGPVTEVAFAPDGRRLASLSCDRLRAWDVATGRVRKEIPGPGRIIRNVTVSPDGTKVAATTDGLGSGRHRLLVCDLASGEPVFSADGTGLAYSPDGRWLAVRAADGTTLLLLDARTHETAARFHGHEKPIWSAAFSPDSRRLASCGMDHTVRLWEVDGGACRVLYGHTDDVFAAAFHPDGRRLATGGRDRAVWVWDLARGEAVARLPGHRSYVWSLAFSPDGATLASGSGDATVGLWDTAPLKARHQARHEAAALRPEAERLVERLWRQTNDNPVGVVEVVRADRSLGEPLRQAALRAVLRRAQPPDVAPGNSHDPP